MTRPNLLSSGRPRKASWTKAVTKYPRAAPASTSEGKCFPPSTRAQATLVATTMFPNWRGSFDFLAEGMELRFRLASVAEEKAPEEWPEGKLLFPLSFGRSRPVAPFINSVAPAVAPRAANSTPLPLIFEYVHSLRSSPLGVARAVTRASPTKTQR